MKTINRNGRLTSTIIRTVTGLAENYGWTDITTHYGDPDCDLTQTFEKGDTYLQITWKGTGRHEEILAVESYVRGPRSTVRPDGMLFYSSIGSQKALKVAVGTILTAP